MVSPIPKFVLFYSVLALFSTQAGAQILSAIIGDEDSVLTFYFPGNSCSEIKYVGWTGPTDGEYFRWQTESDHAPFAKVYLSPNSTDTITECVTIIVNYESGNGCLLSRIIHPCVTGYGIPHDSLVLIRPRVQGYVLNIEKQNKRYYGKFVLKISNNTASTVTVKDIVVNIDSLSQIKLLSIKDSLGIPITSIQPFAKNFPIYFEVESKIGPLKSAASYASSVKFLLSRLGVDSLYISQVNLILSARSDSVIKPSVKSDSFNISIGAIVQHTITYKATDFAENVQFDSLPYPFKITSVNQIDSVYTVNVSCGPAISGTYSAKLKARYIISAFNGNQAKDSILVPLYANVKQPIVNPSILKFAVSSQTEQVQSLTFSILGIVPGDTIRLTSLPYPFFIKSIDYQQDSCTVSIGCKGAGGAYVSPVTINFDIPFYSQKFTQSIQYRIEGEIANNADSVFWEPTVIKQPNISCLGTDEEGKVYAFGSYTYIMSSDGTQFQQRAPLGAYARSFLKQDSLLYITTSGGPDNPPYSLYRSTDTAASWQQLFIGSYNRCPDGPVSLVCDHLFHGLDSIIYLSALGACHPLRNYTPPPPEPYFCKSTDNGYSWTQYEGSVWGMDDLGNFIQQRTPARMTGFARIKSRKFQSDSNGVWNMGGALTSLKEAIVVGLHNIFDTSMIAATRHRGIFVSDDNGANWYGLNGGLPTKQVRSIAYNGERFWISTDSGVYKSKIVKVFTGKVSTKLRDEQLIIYPNPVNNKLSFEINGRVIRCEIYDQLGNRINIPEFDTNGKTLTVSSLNLPNGVYYLKIVIPGRSSFARFIVSR